VNKEFIHSVSNELANILNYWKGNAIDKKNGGYIGRMNHLNQIVDKSLHQIITKMMIIKRNVILHTNI